MSEIAVIIVNYASAALAIEAVESVLARDHGGRTVEVHVVENASPGDDAAMLLAAARERGWAGRCTIHAETVNHGFGRGNNLVIDRLARRATPPQKIFLLNPDARLKNDTIAVLSAFLDAHPRAAAAGARIEKPCGAHVTAAFRFPGVISEFSGALAFGPFARLFARWQVALPPEIASRPVDWVAGAAVMLRLEALADVGPFDPDFFLYFEEVELMHRLNRAGWTCWHVSEAEVVHIEGASTGVRSTEVSPRRRPAYWYRSWCHYFRKTHGRAGALAAGAAWMLGALLNHGLARLRGRLPAAAPHVFEDFWAFAGRSLIGLGGDRHD